MEDKALIALMRDMLEYKKKEARFLFIALIAVVVMNLLMVGAFLYFESQMQTTTTTTTTTQFYYKGEHDGNSLSSTRLR